jgi:hypothetical protein
MDSFLLLAWHAAYFLPAGPFNPFPNHRFRGSLRPVYPLSARREVPSHIQRPDYATDGLPRSELAARGSNAIDVLSAQEQEKMRRVCRIGREVLDAAKAAVRVGVTTDELGMQNLFCFFFSRFSSSAVSSPKGKKKYRRPRGA